MQPATTSTTDKRSAYEHRRFQSCNNVDRWLISRATLGKSLNGVPSPLANDDDSDFGRESWYDRKTEKKGNARGRPRSSKSRKSGVKKQGGGDDDRITNFNLLDHGFPSDESDEEPSFGDDHSEPRFASTPDRP